MSSKSFAISLTNSWAYMAIPTGKVYFLSLKNILLLLTVPFEHLSTPSVFLFETAQVFPVFSVSLYLGHTQREYWEPL